MVSHWKCFAGFFLQENFPRHFEDNCQSLRVKWVLIDKRDCNCQMLQCHFQGMCSSLAEDTHRKHFEMKCNDADNLFHNSSKNKNQVIK